VLFRSKLNPNREGEILLKKEKKEETKKLTRTKTKNNKTKKHK
jgi:hypothetical protein